MYTNNLPLFIHKQNQNGVCVRNICLIQESMHSAKPSVSKFKRVCADSPNLTLITKSATPGEVQVIYMHASIGTSPLKKPWPLYSWWDHLNASSVVMINDERAFVGAGNKICLPTTKVLLRAAIGDPSKSEKLHDWVALSTSYSHHSSPRRSSSRERHWRGKSSRRFLPRLRNTERNLPPRNWRTAAQASQMGRTPRMRTTTWQRKSQWCTIGRTKYQPIAATSLLSYRQLLWRANKSRPPLSCCARTSARRPGYAAGCSIILPPYPHLLPPPHSITMDST